MGRKPVMNQAKRELYKCGLSSVLFISIIPIQSGPQDQKSVTFPHSVISLNQLLKNSKITANIFLTFRNHVKIFLSQNIMHNF